MMNILDKIVATKQNEVALLRKTFTKQQLIEMPGFTRKTNSLVRSFKREKDEGIIAEFKRASPSRGTLNSNAEPSEVIADYTRYGASAVSVLTDKEYFGGSLKDLMAARSSAPDIPILRKDFIIDNYQIFESKAHGADIILLIAACLTISQVQEFSTVAKSLNLEVLLEIHSEEELKYIGDNIDFVGVNNRNLKNFTVDISISKVLSGKIPADKFKISESGISSVAAITALRQYGYKGFLIGENFMKQEDPGEAFAGFMKELANASI